MSCSLAPEGILQINDTMLLSPAFTGGGANQAMAQALAGPLSILQRVGEALAGGMGGAAPSRAISG